MADGDRDHLIYVHGVFGNGMTRTGNASCLSISRDVGPDGLAMGYKEVSVFFWVCCTSCFLSRFSNASRPVADVGC